MAINPYFAGGPTISETPREPGERIDTLPGVSKAGGGLYKPFVEPPNGDLPGGGEPKVDLSAFDISPAGKGDEVLVGDDGDDVLGDPDAIEKQDGNTEQQREEHPMTPSIRHLRKSGKIKTQQQEDELVEHFANDGSIEDIGTLESLKDAQNLQEIKDLLKDMMNLDEGITEQNIIDFTEAVGNDLGIERDKKGGYMNQSDENAVNMIGSHFNIIDTGDKGNDTKNALNTAFSSAHNHLIDGKQFPRNKTFEENSKRVLNENISPKERFEAFKKIMLHVETHQALGGKKDNEISREFAQEKLYTAGIEQEFYATLAEFKKEPEVSKQIELAQELERMRVDAGLSEGEASLLVGGELDRASDTLGENTP